MLTTTSLARALRKIEAELSAALANVETGHPLDAHEVRLAAIKIGCQAEIIERGLVE